MSAPKPKGKLQEMAIRGRDYRDEYEFEMMGEEVTALLSPLPDKKFLPISAFLKEHLGIDEEEAVEQVEEAKEKAEKDGEESIDITKMDEAFVASMQRAARFGIKGSLDDDGEVVEYTDEEAEAMVDMMVGGYSVELGGKVLEISGDVRDATQFRGSRGSI